MFKLLWRSNILPAHRWAHSLVLPCGRPRSFADKTCNVLVAIEQQSADIQQGVDQVNDGDDVGAGDQGLMFGYATDETEEAMPLTSMLSHGLNIEMARLRKNGTLGWLLPDTKTQITCEYKTDGGAVVPQRVHTVVISTQHTEEINGKTGKEAQAELAKELMEKVVKVVIPAKYVSHVPSHPACTARQELNKSCN